MNKPGPSYSMTPTASLVPHSDSATPLLSPAQCIQTCFLLAASLTMGVAALPRRPRAYFLTYGARADKSTTNDAPSANHAMTNTIRHSGMSGKDGDRNHDRPRDLVYGEGEERMQNAAGASERHNDLDDEWFVKVVALVTSWGQVPHSWFGGFYFLSLACSVFWLVQYIVSGRTLQFLTSRQAAAQGPQMTSGQVVLLWSMMFLQGTRRALESFLIVKPGSKSTMWVVHWLIGLCFYIVMSMAVWIEGSGTIAQTELLSHLDGVMSPRAIIGTVLYIIAAIGQYRCHKHLAELKKYSLPTKGLFKILICPHYSFECLLYLSMAMTGAPSGALFNKTISCALFFVATNLSITAGTTAKWYEERFGPDAVKKRWNIIPLVY